VDSVSRSPALFISFTLQTDGYLGRRDHHSRVGGFSSQERRLGVESTPFGVIRRAVWSFQESELSMTLAGKVGTNKELSVTIPGDIISLPARGLLENQISLKLRTNAKAGPNPGVSISTSPSVGSFDSVERLPYLIYDYVTFETGATLTLEFSTTMPMAVGEHLNLILPGFSAIEHADISIVKLDAFSTSRFTAKWVEADHYFQIAWLVPMSKDSRYKVIISSQNGIRLPAAGVRLNDENLKISCSARSGPIMPVAIRFSQAAVGGSVVGVVGPL